MVKAWVTEPDDVVVDEDRFAMPTFKYVAKNRQSKNVSGRISADGKDVVIEELRKRKLIIISIEEVKSMLLQLLLIL
jgi:hypothetical protein